MTPKQTTYSIQRILQEAKIVLELAPQEQKRLSDRRRHRMIKSYDYLTLHAHKLDLQVPRLSFLYFPQQYELHTRKILEQMKERELIDENGEPIQKQ
jgi:hypothetical protein